MTDLDSSFAANGGDGTQRSEARSMPFFPSPPGQPGTPPHGTPIPPGSPSAPLAAPTPAAPAPPTITPPPPLVPSQVQGRHTQRTELGPPQPEGPGTEAVVKGRITIEDEVVEKIAALAVLEIHGIAALSVHAQQPTGREGGVRVHIQNNEAALDLAVVVEYGTVIMDVAKVVKTNVARVVSLMLGMRVTAVNVVVDDVRMPAQ